MSRLILVRHGQAHTFEADSDRLTDLGRRQARLLGDYWALQGVVIDAAFAGTLDRQLQTAEGVAEGLRAAGKPFPSIGSDPGLNEYPASEIFSKLAPALVDRDSSYAGKLDAWRAGGPSDGQNRRFQAAFEPVMSAWLDGSLGDPAIETWRGFRDRVVAALDGIMAQAGHGSTVAVFTSGGPIGVAVQTVLGAPERAALELNWRIRNASLTGVMFSGDRRSLDVFNETPHLADPGLITYR